MPLNSSAAITGSQSLLGAKNRATDLEGNGKVTAAFSEAKITIEICGF